MTRRMFLGGAVALAASGAEEQPSISITMDDVNWQALADPMAANALLLRVAKKFRVQFGLFVIGRNAEGETGQAIVSSWKSAGHLIANHTYSHRPYGALTFEEFSADARKAEDILAPYLSKPMLFRFPALKEGNTAEKRDRMREFLRAGGYRNGHVTIDASDWYFDARLRARLSKTPDFDATRFRRPYLDHLWNRARFYDGLSKEILGRSVPHTLLVHYNLLNSLFLADALGMFAQKGWRVIDAGAAYQDPVFQRNPQTVPAGESLIWALAKETGKFESQLRYPGEDDVYEKPILDRLGL
jgi:hypothetical protein